MLYENNVWRMIFVLKESTEEVIAYAFDLKSFTTAPRHCASIPGLVRA